MWDIKVCDFTLYFLFYNFFLYCFFGWIYESCLVSFRTHSWVNRGFLNGPVIPIYGAGATIVYLFTAPFEENAALVFIVGALIASVLEYVTSYVMERLFHAKWWDYSGHRYNIKGRVCLMATMFWGFLSILMTDVLQPLMNRLIAAIPRRFGEVAGYFIMAIFIGDVIVTVIYTLKLDQKFVELAKIRAEISEYLESTSLYEAKEGWRAKLESLPISGVVENFREQLDNRINQLSMRLDGREELEQKFREFIAKYNKKADLKNIIQKRILKAFPTMKSLRSNEVLEDLRKKRK